MRSSQAAWGKILYAMWTSLLTPVTRWGWLLVAIGLFTGCGVSDTPTTDAQGLADLSITSSAPAGSANSVLVRSGSSPSELIQNGTFSSGSQAWTEGANASRAKYPATGAIITGLPTGISQPATGNTQVARFCNFPGQLVVTSGGTTTTETTNCLDRLLQTFSIPTSANTLTLHVSAYADLAGCTSAKLVLGIKAGAVALTPSITLSSANLTPGDWSDFLVDIAVGNAAGSNATLSVFGTVGGNTAAEKFCSTQQNVNLLISNISVIVKH